MTPRRQTAFLVLSLSFLLGAATVLTCGFRLQPLGWGIAAALSGVMAVALSSRGRAASFCVCLFAFAGGAFAASLQKSVAAGAPPAEYVSYDAVVTGTPQRHGKIVALDALVVDVKGVRTSPFLMKVNISGLDTCTLRIGDGICGLSVLAAPGSGNRRGLAQDRRFSYSRYLRCQGFRAQTLVHASDISRKTVPLRSLSLWQRLRIKLLDLRWRLRSRFAEGGMAGDNLAVASALALGDKSMITPELRSAYSVSGASHVLALSGLHISIIYSLLLLLVDGRRVLRLRLAARLLAIVTVWWYVMLVGLPVSAVRSALMLSVCSVVSAANRGRLTVGHLSFAAFVVVALSPFSLFDVGFQMSFLAVASILLFVPQLERLLFAASFWRRGALRWVSGMVSVSLAAQIGVAPLSAYYFGRFSNCFLLANFVAVPVAMLILYGALAVFLLAWIPPLQRLAVSGLDLAVQFLNDALHLISSLPMASVEGIRMNLWHLAAAYALLAVVCCVMRMSGRYHVIRPFAMGNEP